MKTFLLIAAITISGSLFSQCDFFDDYSTNTGWTQIGNDVEVTNGQLEFINGAIGGEGPGGAGQKRVHKSIGNTLNSGDYWLAQFDFTPITVGSTIGLPFTGHTLLALTAGTQEPYSACPDLPCTSFPNGNQDGIIFFYGADNPPTGNIWIKIKARDGTLEYTSSNQINLNILNTTYYPQLERTTSTNVQLAVFSDAARTNHVAGSPLSLTIPSTITGLTTVQHGNIVRGNYQRELTGSIDDLCINFSPLSDNLVNDSFENLTLYPNPSSNEISINTQQVLKGITIIDITGKVVKDIAPKTNTINVADLPSGLYFIKLIGEKNTITKKFLRN